MNSPVFVEGEQSAPVSEREGVELVETELTGGGEEDDANPRAQNADSIGVDNSDQPDDVRTPEPHEELSTSGVNDPEDVDHETEELTVQVVPETDSSAHRRPSRQRKPPSWYGTWVDG